MSSPTATERLRDYARRLLQQQIEGIADDAFDEDHPEDAAAQIWAALVPESGHRVGAITLSAQEVSDLRALAFDAGGWFDWSPEGQMVVVPLTQWRAAHPG